MSRAVSEIEEGTPAGYEILQSFPAVEPCVIGWTGWPGAGKSSLIGRIVSARRVHSPNTRIAILAVDPSSSFTGGALLGDRIRMDDLALDDRVYIRSLAARGGGGALSPAVMRIARFLASAGFSEIHIETVGAGQSDVLIRSYADLTILVVPPHAGDVIQGLKAGILEIADLFVVNKCDLDGASATAMALESALTAGDSDTQAPAILLASAKEMRGIAEIANEVESRLVVLGETGAVEKRWMQRRESEFRAQLAADMMKHFERSGAFAKMAEEVRTGARSPWSAAAEICRAIEEAGRGQGR